MARRGDYDDGPRRLTRSADRKIAGVCGGIADYFDLDPTLVRIVFVVLLLFPFLPLGIGFILYVVMWSVMPEASPENIARAEERARARSGRSVDGAVLLGGLLVMVGLLFLFQRTVAIWGPAGWLTGALAFFWPAMLVLIGGLILLTALNRRG